MPICQLLSTQCIGLVRGASLTLLFQVWCDCMLAVYCFVGRPGVPLCEYALPGTRGNFNEVTQVLSTKLPTEDGRVSCVLYDGYTFHCLTSHQLHFVCLASDSFSRSVAFQCLAAIRVRFFTCYLPTVPLHSASSSSPPAASPTSTPLWSKSSSASNQAAAAVFPSSFSIPPVAAVRLPARAVPPAVRLQCV